MPRFLKFSPLHPVPPNTLWLGVGTKFLSWRYEIASEAPGNQVPLQFALHVKWAPGGTGWGPPALAPGKSPVILSCWGAEEMKR